MNKNTHAILLALVGGYILYTAYHLIENLTGGKADMSPTAAIIAAVFFGIAGIAVMIYAWKVWKEAKKEAQNEQKEEKQDTMDIK